MGNYEIFWHCSLRLFFVCFGELVPTADLSNLLLLFLMIGTDQLVKWAKQFSVCDFQILSYFVQVEEFVIHKEPNLLDNFLDVSINHVRVKSYLNCGSCISCLLFTTFYHWLLQLIVKKHSVRTFHCGSKCYQHFINVVDLLVHC